MNNKLPIIQSLWISGSLSKIEQLCISSFLFHGHEFHLYTYNDIPNIPKGTTIKDANEIISEKHVFKYNNGSYAIFSDWFRWKLLLVKGDFWVDTDIICVKPFNFDTNQIIFGLQEGLMAGIAVLGFPKNHELCKFLEGVCSNPHQLLPYDSKFWKLSKIFRRIKNSDRSNIGWGEAGGPVGFTNALKMHSLLEQAKEFTYFYPIHYSNFQTIFNETLGDDINLFSTTYAIHFWNEMLRTRKEKYDKNGIYSEKSLFEQLKKKYLD